MSESTNGRVTFNTNAAANPTQNTPVFFCQHIEPDYIKPEISMGRNAYDALRRRNKKLEQVAEAARQYREAGLLSPASPGTLSGYLWDALSDLDKEGKPHA